MPANIHNAITKNMKKVAGLVCLTLYTPTSVFIFSILFSVHLLRCWQGKFVQQTRVSLVGDHFLYSHDTDV